MSDKNISIFVSYSHLDNKWFKSDKELFDLIPFLARSLDKINVKFWYDRHNENGIEAGIRFKTEIENHIDTADIAILLISQEFLNSKFISEIELPRIQGKYENGNLHIFPILLEPCDWEEIEFISTLQLVPGKPTPLIEFTDNEKEWKQVRYDLLKALKKKIDKIAGIKKTTKPEIKTEEDSSKLAKRKINVNKAIIFIASLIVVITILMVSKKILHKSIIPSKNEQSVNHGSGQQSIFLFTESKQNDVFALLQRQLQQENELRSKQGNNVAVYKKEKIKLLNKQREELHNLFYDFNSVLVDFKPRNFVEAFDISNLYFDFSLNNNIKISQSIWLESNMGCFITLSSEMALFSKKISQANIVTWTNLKNISVNINNASLVTFMSSYDPGIIVNNSFSDEYFKNHRNRVVKIDNRLKELLRNKSVLDNAKSDTTIISNIQPLLKDYIIEKINLERTIFNSRLTNDYTETTAKIAQMEIDYAICYLLLIYQYHLLKEKERINYIIDFLEIQKKYITCRDAWIKSKS